jgi:hypothetical protein
VAPRLRGSGTYQQASSPENVMTHVAPAAAGCQMSSHFTKRPTQNLGDSILNSLESLLSKIMSNRPPQLPTPCMLPSPRHFHQCAPPLLLQKPNAFAISQNAPPKTSVIAFRIAWSPLFPKRYQAALPPTTTTPNHACYHFHVISTSACHPYCCRSQTCAI